MNSISIVARCTGERIDPPALVKRHRIEPSNIWRRGEANHRSSIAETSGMNIPVAEVPAAEVAQAVVEWVAAHAALLAEVASQGGETELDFAVFVPAVEARGFQLAAPLLGKLAAAGVAVTVSAYPVSDDDPT